MKCTIEIISRDVNAYPERYEGRDKFEIRGDEQYREVGPVLAPAKHDQGCALKEGRDRLRVYERGVKQGTCRGRHLGSTLTTRACLPPGSTIWMSTRVTN